MNSELSSKQSWMLLNFATYPDSLAPNDKGLSSTGVEKVGIWLRNLFSNFSPSEEDEKELQQKANQFLLQRFPNRDETPEPVAGTYLITSTGEKIPIEEEFCEPYYGTKIEPVSTDDILAISQYLGAVLNLDQKKLADLQYLPSSIQIGPYLAKK